MVIPLHGDSARYKNTSYRMYALPPPPRPPPPLVLLPLPLIESLRNVLPVSSHGERVAIRIVSVLDLLPRVLGVASVGAVSVSTAFATATATAPALV